MKIHVIDSSVAEASTTHLGNCSATGVRWSRLGSPEDYPLRLAVTELDDGGTLSWGTDHGDEAVYVMEGGLDVDGHVAPADGAVIIESGVAAKATAVGTTRVAHFSPERSDPPLDGLYGPPSAEGHTVHVLGPGAWYASGGRENVVARWFADATCPTCRVQLLHVARNGASNGQGPAHSHTQDEIIHVLHGSVMLGKKALTAGMSLCIPADIRYRISGGPDGYAFLNFRRDVSEQVYGGDRATELEGGLARGGVLVNDFR
jgi:quercetin dioxygenase-like cupin family protein